MKSTEKKRLLWISHLVPYPPKGGVLQRSYNMIIEASKHFDLHLFCFVQPTLLKQHFGSIENGLSESKKHFQEYCSTIEFVSIPSERSVLNKYLLGLKGLFYPGGYTNNWLVSASAYRSLETLRNKIEFEYVHYDTISLAPYLNIFDTKTTILDHHNIESHMMYRRAENEPNFIKKLYFYLEARKIKQFEKHYCPKFNLNITCSELDTERLKALSKTSSIETVPNGVDTSYFISKKNRSNVSAKNNLSFIFAGRLNAYTNHAAAIELVGKIWPLILSKFPNSTLYLVGPGSTQEIHSLASRHKGVVITGFVDDVREYIEKSDIYLCPLRDGGGTKLKILDALSMGIPIIANPIACEGINVENGKSVVFATTEKDYLHAIEGFLEDNTLYKSVSDCGIDVIRKQYSYEYLGEIYYNLVKITGLATNSSPKKGPLNKRNLL